MDLFSMIFAGAIHDFEHPGYNNLYLVNSKHKFALWYNDISVLENHHVAASFKILNQKGFNIFLALNTEEQKDLRKRVVTMVLATDMSKHFGD